jgi:predicted ester cyclase
LSDSNQAALGGAVEAFNDPDRRQEYLEVYAEDVILHGYPRGLAGRQGAGSFYSQLWRAFPDARLTVDGVIAHDDQVAVRYRLSGAQARDFYGAPVTGATTEAEGIAWLRFSAGRVVEEWQASGTLDTLTRLAARAAPTTEPRRSASADAAALKWQERNWSSP